MRARILAVAALLLAAFTVLPAAAQTASPGSHSDRRDAATGQGAPGGGRTLAGEPASVAPGFAQVEACPLRVYADAPDDASLAIGAVPYDDVAPRLCAAAAASGGRVTLAAGGTSLLDRELPVVTVTAPWSTEAAAANDAREQGFLDDPAGSAARWEAGELPGYRPAILLTANIHGNELEGTDAALDLVDHLATAALDAPLVETAEGRTPEQLAALPTVGEFLEQFRLVVIPTANPDGRFLGQRANANGLDLNRDHITQSQPETLVVRDTIIAAQPVLLGDHHGYVGPGGLIEPCTPPHGTAYEYDLFIANALPQGLALEAEVFRRPSVAANLEVARAEVPFRDTAQGWDDWPPIFTPQYAAYHGGNGLTLEMPLFPLDPTLRPEEIARRVATNIGWQRATMDATLLFGMERREELVADQIELYRRGAAGEPSRNGAIPDGSVAGFGPEDRWATAYPRAYVIPLGGGQASERSAHRLAQFLVDNDVAVGVAERAIAAGDVTAPAGSYVVDLQQAKRGLAHAVLGHGQDISEAIDLMYDISGWSLADLWGATVTSVETLDIPVTPSSDAMAAGGVEDGPAAAYGFALTSEAEIRLLNALLAEGTTVQRAGDGTVLVGTSARDRLAELAAMEGVAVRAVPVLPEPRYPLTPLRVGVTGGRDQETLLRALGFDVMFLTAASDAADPSDLNADPGVLDAVDVIYASQPLDWQAMGPAARAAFLAWLDAGGGYVSEGPGFQTLLAAGVMPNPGWVAPNVNANGVVAVEQRTDSPVMPGRGAATTSFGYPPSWFLASFPTWSVEQRLLEGPTVLLSGHWPTPASGLEESQHTQAEAAGLPLTVAGPIADGAARAVLTGAAPLFRWHPVGLFDEVVDWLLWTVQGEPTTAGLAPRLAGATRIETAVAISRATFAGPVAEVVVTTAADFPDALAAGPSAGVAGSPVLLTPPDAVPAVVLAELRRLAPERIVVVGGEASVSEAAAADLLAVAPVVRRAGPNRFATAAAVSRAVAEPDGTVVLATGATFPDALSGGVLAGELGGPVLLAERDRLPAETAEELARLAPAEVVVLGGAAAVSDAVVAEVTTLTGAAARRLAGSDRFATAAAVAGELDSAEVAYLANGATFADALAGTPAAITAGGAILLVQPDVAPQPTLDALAALTPSRVVALGGPAAVSDAVLEALQP